MGKTVNLRARRQFKYATRRLLPGDIFEATGRDARLLIAAKLATQARPPAEVPAPPPELALAVAKLEPPQPDMAPVRAEYERVMGKRPFLGWDIAELQRRMAAGPDA